jgi:hypothetical protein
MVPRMDRVFAGVAAALLLLLAAGCGSESHDRSLASKYEPDGAGKIACTYVGQAWDGGAPALACAYTVPGTAAGVVQDIQHRLAADGWSVRPDQWPYSLRGVRRNTEYLVRAVPPGQSVVDQHLDRTLSPTPPGVISLRVDVGTHHTGIGPH